MKKAKITKKTTEKKDDEAVHTTAKAKSAPKPKPHVETDKAIDAYVKKVEDKKKLKTNKQKEDKLLMPDPFADEVQATIDRLLAGERFFEEPIPVPAVIEPVLVPEPVAVIPEPIVEEVIADP